MGTEKNNYPKLDHPDVLRFVFYPRKQINSKRSSNVLDHKITVDEEVEIGGRFYLAGPADPHILFFHGNGEICSDYDDVGHIYNSFRINLLAVDYRGYGASGGFPGVTSMIRDAHVILKDIIRWMKDQERTGPLVVMGRSLGSASALELASHHEPEISGLIIESGFAYTVPLLNFLGVDTRSLGISESDCLRHMEKIARFSKPTLIIHAEFDQFIPFSDAEALLKNSPSLKKEFVMVPEADHNSIMMMAGREYFEKIKNFIIQV